MARTPRPAAPKPVEAFQHQASRLNIPTAELQSLAQQVEELAPLPPVRYPRARPLPPGETRPRDGDRDPQIIWNGVRITLTEPQRRQLQERGTVEIGDAQLVWRGKDTQDWSDLVVQAPPIYVQEKVHPKAIIAALTRQSAARRQAASDQGPDLFADFNGLPDPEAKLEFYQHPQHWANRMILGDSLQVMASLAEREGLRGKVQCIYFDPPYGIKFNSNWQVSTQSRDVKDGKREDLSREPEQVKAFRDTWKDGIHSYLTYLRDRLTVARVLLTESGSIFVQIGDENVHRVRVALDEVFGAHNFAGQIFFLKTTGKGSKFVDASGDHLLWYARDASVTKVRPAFRFRSNQTLEEQYNMISPDNLRYRRLSSAELRSPATTGNQGRRFMPSSIYSDSGGETTRYTYTFEGAPYQPLLGYFWRTPIENLGRVDGIPDLHF
jgi:adenine-specific DNA-methyltransferase